jgi:hypothetical protein
MTLSFGTLIARSASAARLVATAYSSQALELGAFLGGANDGAGLGHEAILVPSGAIRLGPENSN